MAMFIKETPDMARPDAPKPTSMPSSSSGNDAALSIIAPGTKVTGDIETNSVLKIEGVVEGTIRGARQVLVGRQGEVKGDIHSREVVVGGRVEGTVTAAERVEVQNASSVNGDIFTKSIIVLEGGKVNGTVRMEDAAVPMPSKQEMRSATPHTPQVAVVR
jgi:cytoskeletal protein CcmA (bactofilin family)